MPAQVQSMDSVNELLLGKVESRLVEGQGDILKKYLDDMKVQQDEALKIADPKKRQEKLNLINAKFAQVRSGIEADRADISGLVMSFMELEKKLGFEVEEYGKPTPEEAAREKRALDEVTTANAMVVAAPSKATFFGMRDPVALANAALEKAQRDLIEVKADISKAIQDRMREAKLDENLGTLQSRGERAYQALVGQHGQLVIQIETIRKDRDTAFEMAQKTTQAIEKLDIEITDLTSELETARDNLDHLTEESANYLTAKEAVSQLESKLQEKSSDRTALLGVSREETIYATRYEGYLSSFIEAAGNVKAAAAIQQSKNRNIAQQRKHYAKLMEALSKMERTMEMVKAGNEVDRRLFQTVIEAGAATTNSRQEFMQEQPGRLAEVQDRRAEQDEAILNAAGIDRKIREDFAKRFLSDGAVNPAA
jgi:hypothetical protein